MFGTPPFMAVVPEYAPRERANRASPDRTPSRERWMFGAGTVDASPAAPKWL
jgi:hypothetical protein